MNNTALLADYLRIKGGHGEWLNLALAARAAAEHLHGNAVAGAENNLGNAYGTLQTGDRGDNLKRAIACYEATGRGYAAVGMTNEAERARTMAERLEHQPGRS